MFLVSESNFLGIVSRYRKKKDEKQPAILQIK